MNFSLLIKVATIAFLALLLLIPVLQIRGLIEERASLRDGVVREMARDAGYAQSVTGPLLVVPYRKTVRTWTEETEEKPRTLVTHEVPGELLFLPDDLQLAAELNLQERKRGIYRARIYEAQTEISGHFKVPAQYGITSNIEDYAFGHPSLELGISDVRGIGNALELNINGQGVPFAPGVNVPMFASGVHADLTEADISKDRELKYNISLSLQGSGEFRVTPMGRESRVRVTSNWPHPSFVGAFFPRERQISQQGFSAKWHTSFFATNLENVVESCRNTPIDPSGCPQLQSKNFGVTFVDPVDQYLKSERATKYAFLFIGLTFAVFFLFEVLRRLNVHPVQYGLVGLSLAVFFLLLLALAEHIGFGAAYFVSTVASLSLVGYYVAHVLQNVLHAAGFSVILAALYGVLYGILSSEDYALLTGSLVVFGVLAFSMVLTRTVDWSAFGRRPDHRAD